MKLLSHIFVEKIVVVFSFLIMLLITPHQLFSMQICSATQTAPPEIITHILSIPDREKIFQIIAIQEKRNVLQHNTDRKIIPPTQKSFWHIQEALFPCFALTQTCKQFHKEEFKESVVQASQVNLLTIFPQGVALFLLPKPLQIDTVENLFKKHNNDLGSIVNLCYRKDDLECVADNFFQTFVNDEALKNDNEILNNPNDIIYVKSGLAGGEPDIESYTVIEYILYRLSYRIHYVCRVGDHYTDLTLQELKHGFKNFFIVIDRLCCLDTLDLSFPAAQSNRILAKEITHQFGSYPYPKSFFSEKSSAKITNATLLSNLKPEPITENEHVLSTLARTYLSINSKFSDQQKVAAIKQQKKQLEDQEHKIKRVLSKLNNTFTIFERRQFRNNLIKIGVIIILCFMATILIFKKFIGNDTHFSSVYPFCKLFYHR